MATHGPFALNEYNLFRAIRVGNLKTVTESISDNLHWSTSALCFAVIMHNKELVQMLIDRGAEVNAKDLNNSTALHYASKDNALDIALLLIQHKADINVRNNCNQTPLTLAVINNNISMIDTLVQYGADVNVKGENGFRPLHTALQNCHVDTVKCLLSKNVDLNAKTDNNLDPLYIAITCGDEGIVYHLLEAGASIHTEDIHNHADGVKMPLHVACHYGRTPIVRMLLRKGANIHALSEYNIRIGAGCGANYVENETKMTPLHCAAYRGSRQVCKELLMNGADVNARTPHGLTPLHLASGYGYNEVALLLLRCGADINAATDIGLTSLHFAALEGTTCTTSLLLEKGANVNARSKNGLTPLHLEAKRGQVQSVRVILNYRPDIDAVDVNGNTALHFAVESDETVLALIDQDCDVNIVNDHGDAGIRMVPFNDKLCVSVKRYCLQKSNPDHYNSVYTRKYYKSFGARTTTRVHEYLTKVFHAGAHMADSNITNLSLLATYQNQGEWTSFGKNCKEELEKMKTTEIEKTNVTFYDILTEPTGKIIPFLRNENVVDAIVKHNLHRQFPAHEHLIKARFDKAMTQQKLLDESVKFFSAGFIPNLRMDLPDLCVRKIFSYLRDEDLSNLKDIFEDVRSMNVKREE